jgi:hypothetical protein
VDGVTGRVLLLADGAGEALQFFKARGVTRVSGVGAMVGEYAFPVLFSA